MPESLKRIVCGGFALSAFWWEDDEGLRVRGSERLKLWRARFLSEFVSGSFEAAMGVSSSPDGVIELSEGLSLVPCTVVALSFVRADVSVKPVDEWELKVGLMAMFKKRFGLVVPDRDLVVHREKNYFKRRRDEPIADGTLHLWGSVPGGEAAKARHEGADFGKHFVENVNGLEISVGGLKLKCLAVIKETNDFDALKRSWEAVFGPRRGGG